MWIAVEVINWVYGGVTMPVKVYVCQSVVFLYSYDKDGTFIFLFDFPFSWNGFAVGAPRGGQGGHSALGPALEGQGPQTKKI